jgi:hypothetical protein
MLSITLPFLDSTLSAAYRILTTLIELSSTFHSLLVPSDSALLAADRGPPLADLNALSRFQLRNSAQSLC